MDVQIAAPVDDFQQIANELADRVRRYEARKDSRCVFAYCYYLLTLEIVRALPRTPIADPAWVSRLGRMFVDRYFASLDAADTDRPIPAAAWARVFETSRDRYTSVLEDVIFGMAAHIIADLPHTLVDVELADASGRSRIADYHALNDILGDAIAVIQRDVARRYAPYIRWLDRLGHGQDELLTSYGIRLSRAAAWYNALRLLEPASRDAASAAVQKSAIIVVDELTRPPWLSLTILFRALRVVVAWLRRWPRTPLPERSATERAGSRATG